MSGKRQGTMTVELCAHCFHGWSTQPEIGCQHVYWGDPDEVIEVMPAVVTDEMIDRAVVGLRQAHKVIVLTEDERRLLAGSVLRAALKSQFESVEAVELADGEPVPAPLREAVSSRTQENAPYEVRQVGGVAMSLWMTGANHTDCKIVARMRVLIADAYRGVSGPSGDGVLPGVTDEMIERGARALAHGGPILRRDRALARAVLCAALEAPDV